jgi:hypothetical protein
VSEPKTFPRIPASSRTYDPGEYPQTVFEAQNGATAVIRFGRNRVNSSLKLGFTALSDAEVVEIFKHYEAVNSEWNYVRFDISFGASSGVEEDDLKKYIRETDSGLRWRYSKPPKITATFKGRHDLSCEFVAFLDSENV